MGRLNTRLHFETLEDRRVPALLLTFNPVGDLIGISGRTNEKLFLTFFADDSVTVKEGAADLGTHDVGATLAVSLGPTAASAIGITMDLNGFRLNGDFRATLGNAGFGYDLSFNDGVFGGDFRLKAGTGSEALHIGSTAPATFEGLLKLNVGGGSDIVEIKDCFLNGDVTVRGAQVFTLDNTSVVGLLTVLANGEPFTVGFVFKPTVILFGGARLVTSFGGDDIQLAGALHGTIRINMSGGNDELTIDTTTIDLLFANGGAGTDTFTASVPISFPMDLRSFY